MRDEVERMLYVALKGPELRVICILDVWAFLDPIIVLSVSINVENMFNLGPFGVLIDSLVDCMFKHMFYMSMCGAIGILNPLTDVIEDVTVKLVQIIIYWVLPLDI